MWSGARDAKGYATGYGTLTWFAPQNEVVTGSHIARERHDIVTSRAAGMMVHGKFEEAPANAEPKKRGQTDISEQRAPSAQIEATPKKPQPTPAQEKATSPMPTPSPTPGNDSMDSSMHVPSSLKLSPPPDIPLQLTPAPSPQ